MVRYGLYCRINPQKHMLVADFETKSEATGALARCVLSIINEFWKEGKIKDMNIIENEGEPIYALIQTRLGSVFEYIVKESD